LGGKNISMLTVYIGDSVTLNAVPDNGWHFVKWQRDSLTVGTNVNYSFVATSGSGGTIIARFEQNETPPKVKFSAANISLKPGEWVNDLYLLINGVPTKAVWQLSNTGVVALIEDSLGYYLQGLVLGTVRITAQALVGGVSYEAQCTVYVEEQAIVIEETSTVTNGSGTTEVALEIPSQTPFYGSFTVALPAGVSINTGATQIASEWSGIVELQIISQGNGVWTFVFTVNEAVRSQKLRAAVATNNIVNIVYDVDETVTEDFELKIKDLSLTLEDEGNTVIERAETVVPVTVNSPTSIINISEIPLTIYPNPVKDNLYIISADQMEKAEIYTLAGKMVKSEQISGNSINVSQLPQGIYLIKIGNCREKFVKK
jgi:hypothetical protein